VKTHTLYYITRQNLFLYLIFHNRPLLIMMFRRPWNVKNITIYYFLLACLLWNSIKGVVKYCMQHELCSPSIINHKITHIVHYYYFCFTTGTCIKHVYIFACILLWHCGNYTYLLGSYTCCRGLDRVSGGWRHELPRNMVYGQWYEFTESPQISSWMGDEIFCLFECGVQGSTSCFLLSLTYSYVV